MSGPYFYVQKKKDQKENTNLEWSRLVPLPLTSINSILEVNRIKFHYFWCQCNRKHFQNIAVSKWETYLHIKYTEPTVPCWSWADMSGVVWSPECCGPSPGSCFTLAVPRSSSSPKLREASVCCKGNITSQSWTNMSRVMADATKRVLKDPIHCHSRRRMSLAHLLVIWHKKKSGIKSIWLCGLQRLWLYSIKGSVIPKERWAQPCKPGSQGTLYRPN